jgi:hypothetical protein
MKKTSQTIRAGLLGTFLFTSLGAVGYAFAEPQQTGGEKKPAPQPPAASPDAGTAPTPPNPAPKPAPAPDAGTPAKPKPTK